MGLFEDLMNIITSPFTSAGAQAMQNVTRQQPISSGGGQYISSPFGGASTPQSQQRERVYENWGIDQAVGDIVRGVSDTGSNIISAGTSALTEAQNIIRPFTTPAVETAARLISSPVALPAMVVATVPVFAPAAIAAGGAIGATSLISSQIFQKKETPTIGGGGADFTGKIIAPVYEGPSPEISLYSSLAKAAAETRPGYTPISQLGDTRTGLARTGVEMMSRAGFNVATPEDITGRVLEAQRQAAYQSSNIRAAQYYGGELQKWAENPVELASAYHRIGMKAGVPIPANPYEYRADLAVEFLKGKPQKASEWFSPVSGEMSTSLPGGEGLQQYQWRTAIATEKEKPMPEAVSFAPGVERLISAEGQYGPYGALAGAPRVIGYREESIKAASQLPFAVTTPVPTVVPTSAAKSPDILKAIGEFAKNAPILASVYSVISSPLSVEISPTLGLGTRAAPVEGGPVISGGLPAPFRSTSVPSVGAGYSPPMVEWGGPITKLLGMDTRISAETEPGKFISFATGGIAKNIDMLLGLIPGAPSVAPKWLAIQEVSTKPAISVKFGEPVTTVTGGNQTITQLGTWLDVNREAAQKSTPEGVALYNKYVNIYNEMSKQNPIVTTTVQETLTTKPEGKIYKYGMWDVYAEKSGEAFRNLFLGGASEEQVRGLGERVKSQPGLSGDINRLIYGAGEFMSTRPLDILPALATGAEYYIGGELVGAGVSSLAGGSSFLAPAARILTTPGTGGLFGTAARGLATYGPPVYIAGLTAYDLTRGFTASKEEIEMNIGRAAVPGVAMLWGGVGPSFAPSLHGLGSFTYRSVMRAPGEISAAFGDLRYGIGQRMAGIERVEPGINFGYVEDVIPSPARGGGGGRRLFFDNEAGVFSFEGVERKAPATEAEILEQIRPGARVASEAEILEMIRPTQRPLTAGEMTPGWKGSFFREESDYGFFRRMAQGDTGIPLLEATKALTIPFKTVVSRVTTTAFETVPGVGSRLFQKLPSGAESVISFKPGTLIEGAPEAWTTAERTRIEVQRGETIGLNWQTGDVTIGWRKVTTRTPAKVGIPEVEGGVATFNLFNLPPSIGIAGVAKTTVPSAVDVTSLYFGKGGMEVGAFRETVHPSRGTVYKFLEVPELGRIRLASKETSEIGTAIEDLLAAKTPESLRISRYAAVPRPRHPVIEAPTIFPASPIGMPVMDVPELKIGGGLVRSLKVPVSAKVTREPVISVTGQVMEEPAIAMADAMATRVREMIGEFAPRKKIPIRPLEERMAEARIVSAKTIAKNLKAFKKMGVGKPVPSLILPKIRLKGKLQVAENLLRYGSKLPPLEVRMKAAKIASAKTRERNVQIFENVRLNLGKAPTKFEIPTVSAEDMLSSRQYSEAMFRILRARVPEEGKEAGVAERAKRVKAAESMALVYPELGAPLPSSLDIIRVSKGKEKERREELVLPVVGVREKEREGLITLAGLSFDVVPKMGEVEEVEKVTKRERERPMVSYLDTAELVKPITYLTPVIGVITETPTKPKVIIETPEKPKVPGIPWAFQPGGGAGSVMGGRGKPYRELFEYDFNVRAASKVIQGMLKRGSDLTKAPISSLKVPKSATLPSSMPSSVFGVRKKPSGKKVKSNENQREG